MPGFELIDNKEKKAVNELFEKSGVLFRHGFDKQRKGIYKVIEFEKKFARKFNVPYARAVSSGTAALLVALKAMGVKAGDEVITQSFTFVATVEAIIEAGAVPVITEINETLNMDPVDFEKKITKKTKVVIPVHMLGGSAEVHEIMKIAKKHKILVLEDAAQALGAEYKGKKLGTIGDAGIFSFDFGKTMTTGEGGMVVTKNKKIYDLAKEYSDHGHQNNVKLPRHEDSRRISGFNFSMTELQGAVGLVQLEKLNYMIKNQRHNSQKIQEGLKEIKGIEFRKSADAKGDSKDTLIFFVESEKRAKAIGKKLMDSGIGVKNIPSAMSWHFAGTWDHMLLQFSRYKNKKLKNVWKKSYNIVSQAVALPIMVEMPGAKINNMIKIVKKILSET